jgi:hypothetical protein
MSTAPYRVEGKDLLGAGQTTSAGFGAWVLDEEERPLAFIRSTYHPDGYHKNEVNSSLRQYRLPFTPNLMCTASPPTKR